jgi:hypothetical protein
MTEQTAMILLFVLIYFLFITGYCIGHGQKNNKGIGYVIVGVIPLSLIFIPIAILGMGRKFYYWISKN